MLHRREIDGLRAMAVTAVVLDHAGLPYLPGGFLGVDIFFVISGYLITGIIVRDIEAGRFSMRAFYERRARRILPALLVMLLATIPFAWIWLLPLDFKDYAQSLLASLFSYANIHFATKAGYFAPDAHRVPLLHTWSLAVEEQFYLLFPVFVLLVARKGRGRLVPAMAGLCFLSFIVCLIGVRAFPTVNFYCLTSRAWELLAGGLFSFTGCSRSRRVNEAASLAGFALIALSILVPTSQQDWPSFLTLGPVLGTGLLLVFGVERTVMGRLLSWPPFVGLGRVSYSLYLWHQPIFAFARIRSMGEPTLPVMIALSLAALAVSILSWRYVEQPVRQHIGPWRIGSRTPRLLGGAAAALIVSTGVAGNVTKGLPWRLPSAVTAMVRASAWNKACLYTAEADLPVFPLKDCLHNPGHPVTYAIWGDSISASVSEILAAELDRRGTSLQQLTHGYCAPLPGVSVPSVAKSAHCGPFNESALAQILASPEITTVVMAASWIVFLSYPEYQIDGVTQSAGDEVPPEIRQRLRDTIATIEASGRRVVLVYPHPKPAVNVIGTVTQQMLAGVARPEVTMAYADFVQNSARSRAVLDAVASPRTIKVFPEEVFCARSQGGTCALTSDGLPYLADTLHFTASGARLAVAAILGKLPIVPVLPMGPVPDAADDPAR
ncbi:acyltransferase family protein [Rhizobium sp. Leaf341]|uniref:acyltransferase family protein n=1 Tax=Rhizobium sp. Leaf341 TaxID=1736344 RepID=UPI0007151FE5|nr:acyltransferase family protein [Rhizobium sp. Leaf341]KQR73415.1 hypothetical protein ASG03_00980 [Rhizobium sp. Leaf341]